jgi:hypothetical protein
MAGSDPLLHHIRHAEDWLCRARTDWRSGNAPAAMLRLMLAEAEIRHARETGAGIPSARAGGASASERGAGNHRVGWPRAAAAMAAAAVLAAGFGYASMWFAAQRHDTVAATDGPAQGLSPGAGQAGGGIVRTIVRLDSGEFLMPEGGRAAAGPAPGDPTLVVPADLRTPTPTF